MVRGACSWAVAVAVAGMVRGGCSWLRTAELLGHRCLKVILHFCLGIFASFYKIHWTCKKPYSWKKLNHQNKIVVKVWNSADTWCWRSVTTGLWSIWKKEDTEWYTVISYVNDWQRIMVTLAMASKDWNKVVKLSSGYYGCWGVGASPPDGDLHLPRPHCSTNYTEAQIRWVMSKQMPDDWNFQIFCQFLQSD